MLGETPRGDSTQKSPRTEEQQNKNYVCDFRSITHVPHDADHSKTAHHLHLLHEKRVS